MKRSYPEVTNLGNIGDDIAMQQYAHSFYDNFIFKTKERTRTFLFILNEIIC